jgi:NAD(P)-dependent dehydrogenase (short-subunit alcohol dehydrogenase family)
MSVASTVRALRSVSDLLVPISFNRVGFELNRRGFDPTDPPDLPRSARRARVALVTGANSGIGRATASALARRGFEVWLLCRDRGRGEEVLEALGREHGHDRVRLGVVDVSSVASIRRFVRDEAPSHVDVLVHNAGVLPDRKSLSGDGVEVTFATSVLGPFALTGLLLDRMRESSDARVIFVSSGGMYLQRLDLSLLDVEEAKFDGVTAYANAKRAQVILARLFAERFSRGTSLTFASMHPGWVDTAAVRTSLPRFHEVMKRFLRTAEQGADTVVWLAASERPRGTLGKLWFDRRAAPVHPFPWTRERTRSREALLAFCEEKSGISLESVVPVSPPPSRRTNGAPTGPRVGP